MTDTQGTWMAVLVFAAAAWHLRPRDQWIGWTDEQRRRRLALVANNVRFLLLPERPVPDLGSATLSCLVARLSAAWQAPYVLIHSSWWRPSSIPSVSMARSTTRAAGPNWASPKATDARCARSR